MYSRLPLSDTRINYKVDKKIPSITTKVRLPSGDLIQVYTIHPTPPMPQHNPMSSDRDTEMMLTALEAMDAKLPVIVIGDFNDVAWSQTSILFQRVSGLLDPRKGRGLYNTFNAKNILMRWPLDHVFVSPEFRVINIERTKSIASDHFPVYAKFSLEPEGAVAQLPTKPTEEDLKNAKEQMSEAIDLTESVY
jgi:endonuclease/exonuclease/phosphatase (EEP) superfamily protein YafD